MAKLSGGAVTEEVVNLTISMKAIWHAHYCTTEIPYSEQYGLHSFLCGLIGLGVKEIVLRSSKRLVRHMVCLEMAVFDCRPMSSEIDVDNGMTLLKDNTAYIGITKSALNKLGQYSEVDGKTSIKFGLYEDMKDKTVVITVDIDMRNDNMSGTPADLSKLTSTIQPTTPRAIILRPTKIFMPLKDYVNVDFKILRGSQP